MAKYQHILEVAFLLFSERGIEPVTMPEVAKASGVGRATLYRYFETKLDLVVAIGTWTWEKYITMHNTSIPKEEMDLMTGAQRLRFYLDSFLDRIYVSQMPKQLHSKDLYSCFPASCSVVSDELDYFVVVQM